MAVDDRRLRELLEESQDHHADAMRDVRAALPSLEEIGRSRRRQRVDGEGVEGFDRARRRALGRLGVAGAAGLATRAAAYGSLGGLLHALLAAPARADVALDIQILQTASSLERLAVDTYTAVLAADLGGIATLPGPAGQVVKQFFLTTTAHHDEHRKAFQAQTTALGGPVQERPNPKLQAIVASRLTRLGNPVDVLDLAATLEKVATDTYLVSLGALENLESKGVTAGVMGVEAQHLGVARAVGALLRAGTPDLVKIPLGPDVSRLPRTAGTPAFPDALHRVNPPELLAQPETGAVR